MVSTVFSQPILFSLLEDIFPSTTIVVMLPKITSSVERVGNANLPDKVHASPPHFSSFIIKQATPPPS